MVFFKKNINISKDIFNITLFLSQFFVLYLFCIFLLLEFGFYSNLSLIIGSILTLVLTIYISKEFTSKAKNYISVKSSSLLLLLIFIFTFSFLNVYYFHDTLVDGSQDPGRYAMQAYSVSQTDKVKNRLTDATPSSPGVLYDSRKGEIFRYQYPYIGYLSLYTKISNNYDILKYSNLIFIIFGGILLFFLLSFYIKEIYAIMAIILIFLSYPFIWFTRQTVTENLSFFIIIVVFLFYFLFKKRQSTYYLFLTSLSLFLLSFVRIEAIIGVFLFYLLLFLNRKEINFNQKSTRVYLIFSLLSFLNFIYFSAKIHPFYYGHLLETFGHLFKYSFFGTSSNISPEFNPHNINDYLIHYTYLIFSNYKFHIYYLFSIFGFLIFLKKKGKKVLYCSSGLLLVFLPFFGYLIKPEIAPINPWFLRRFYWCVLPIMIIFTLFFLKETIKNRKIFTTIFIFLFILTITTSSSIICYKNFGGFYSEIDKINQVVGENKDSLILLSTGTPWRYTLARYFDYIKGQNSIMLNDSFDLSKLDDFVDQDKYNNIYFICNPDTKLCKSQFFKKIKNEKVILDYNRLETTYVPWRTKGYPRFDYFEFLAISSLNRLPDEVIRIPFRIRIYTLK